MQTFTTIQFVDALQAEGYDIKKVVYKDRTYDGEKITLATYEPKNIWWELQCVDIDNGLWTVKDSGFIRL